MNIFALSDIHGHFEEFLKALSLVDLAGDSKLILLGDYIHGGQQPIQVLAKIMELEKELGSEKVIVLLGNHEEAFLERQASLHSENFNDVRDTGIEKRKYMSWFKTLRRYYVLNNKIIFCHAGVDEEAEDLWALGTSDYVFTGKYPADTGEFCMTIVAGHVGTSEIAGNPSFHDIFWDGKSHYYIDGSVMQSGIIPVLKIDTEKNTFYQLTERGEFLIHPYGKEN